MGKPVVVVLLCLLTSYFLTSFLFRFPKQHVPTPKKKMRSFLTLLLAVILSVYGLTEGRALQESTEEEAAPSFIEKLDLLDERVSGYFVR